MVLCYVCEKPLEIKSDNSINSNNLAIKDNDRYICVPCKEVCEFLQEDKKENTKPKVKDKIIENPKPKIIETSYYCSLCKSFYKGGKCNECNFINPLYIKRKKGKKKKK